MMARMSSSFWSSLAIRVSRRRAVELCSSSRRTRAYRKTAWNFSSVKSSTVKGVGRSMEARKESTLGS